MPRKARRSESVDDFIKAVYTLQQSGQRVSTTTLCDTLEISAPSVTDMAQRLVAAGLVDYQKYRGVILTPAGEAMALKVIRRHRLIELFLVQHLNYELREVHDEAERLEHVVSERFIDAIAHSLGHPSFDPHGDPIPADDGTIARRMLIPLTELAIGTSGIVAQLKTESAEMIQHMLDRGFRLGAVVTPIEQDPFDGPVRVQIDGSERVIGHHVARCIYVEST